MRIKGSGKADYLVGTTANDVIDGGAGNDTIYGGVGTDYLTGGRGADTFVIGARSQYDIITDFNAAEGDRIVFDFGDGVQSVYSGQLSDGLSFATSSGVCTVGCVDINADGIMDTQLNLNGQNVFLLGYEPSQISGASILG